MNGIQLRPLGASLLVSMAALACAGDEASQAEATSNLCTRPIALPLNDISLGEADGLLFYEFVGSAPQSHLDAIRAAMDTWELRTGVVQYIEAPGHPRAETIQVDEPLPVPPPGMRDACTQRFIPLRCAAQALHEIGHRAELAHEQHRFDRDRFITVNVNHASCNDGSVGNRYVDSIWSGTNYGPYNENSIMHYTPAMAPDGTFNFTRKDDSTNGLGSLGMVTNGDVNSVREHQARHVGWDRFRSWGTTLGSNRPMESILASGVSFDPSRPIAAARVRRVDVVMAFGDDGNVYMRSKGTRLSGWRFRWSGATAIAATTMGRNGELALARMTPRGLLVDVSNTAQDSALGNPVGDNAFLDGIVWPSTWVFGLPPGTGAITSIDVASLGDHHLAAIARRSDGSIWMRTTNMTRSFERGWNQVATNTRPETPRLVAFNSELHVLFAMTPRGGENTLVEVICDTQSCGTRPQTIRTVPAGTSFAAAASESEMHIVYRDVGGNLEWNFYGGGSSTTKITGQVTLGSLVATNTFEDRFGAFGLFARLTDDNIWRKEYNRFLPGRLGNVVTNDYDQDGKTDPVIVRNGTWWVRPSTGLPDVSFAVGQTGDVLLPAANYGGNWTNDLMIFRNGTWRGTTMGRSKTIGITTSIVSTGSLPAQGFGYGSDIPVPGDYDGDGLVDEAVFRPSNGTWYARPSGGGPDLVESFGRSTDRPVPGDYDGDGRTDRAVFRPSNGTWYARPSSGGVDIVQQYGAATDRLVQGDWDGDGRTDFAVFRPSNGKWYAFLRTGDRISTQFGQASDRVVPGDYDGDGRLDPAVFRPSNGTWYARPSGGGSDIVRSFGTASDSLPWASTTQ